MRGGDNPQATRHLPVIPAEEPGPIHTALVQPGATLGIVGVMGPGSGPG
jgi:hypothetical protein